MKINKRIFTVLLIACLSLTAIGLSACGGAEIKSISVDTEEAYLVCEVGKEFSTAGIKILGKQGNGQNIRLSSDKYTMTKPDTSTVGEKTITVTHEEMTATFKINVVVREVTVVFAGVLTCGYSAGNYVLYPAEFRCYNTLEWELWYRAQTTISGISGLDKTSPTLGTRPIRLRTVGRYRVADGVYSMVLALETVKTTADGSGAISFKFQDPSLPYTEYENNATYPDGTANSKGIFYGTLTLVTT